MLTTTLTAALAIILLMLWALFVALGLPVAVFALLLVALGINFLLRRTQKAQVMLRVLLEIFSCNPVIAQLRIAGQLIVFLDDLLRRAAHFALGARAVENPIHHITNRIG